MMVPDSARGRPFSRGLEFSVEPARPLIPPAPRSAMFFPLVVVVAVLPGLFALKWWDFNPPAPWWGLRGLAVCEGWTLDQVHVGDTWPANESRWYRMIALQPPLLAWLEALGLSVSPFRNPLATVLPSYAAGILAIILVYLHGRVWFGPGLGLTAAVLTAMNHELLVQMQQASPSTLGLTGLLLALFAYVQFVRKGTSVGWTWILLSGLGVGIAFLSVGLLGLLPLPVVVLHQAFLGAEQASAGAPRRSGRSFWLKTLWGKALPGILALAVGVSLALPWHVYMGSRYGGEFWSNLAGPAQPWTPTSRGLLYTLLFLAPATLPLCFFALVRAMRAFLASEDEDETAIGNAFWIAWLATAALVAPIWSGGPQSVLRLFLLVPVNLLAGRAMLDLADRSVPAKNLVWLAPATALCVTWWLSDSMRSALAGIGYWKSFDARALLGLHLLLDLILLLAVLTKRLDRWARRRDYRRRLILAGYLLTVFGITAATGLREVQFRHEENRDLLDLRSEILRRDRLQPIEVLAVVGSDPVLSSESQFLRNQAGATQGAPVPAGSPGGRLRFILRTALPQLAQLDFQDTQTLRSVLPQRPRLVIVLGAEQQFPYQLQSELGLEMIYAGRSGVGLNAFATIYNPPRRARR